MARMRLILPLAALLMMATVLVSAYTTLQADSIDGATAADELPFPEPGIVVVSPKEALTLAKRLEAGAAEGPRLVAVVNDGKGSMAEAVAALARAAGLLLPLGRPVGPEGGAPLHPALAGAQLVLLDLRGRGLVVVEGLPLVRGLEYALSLVGPADYTVSGGFRWIGYIGWVKASAGGINYGGDMMVRVDYYYAASGSPASLGFWLAVTRQIAVGDCAGLDTPPEWMTAETDWMTRLWPAQVLVDWGPGNTPPLKTISYTVSLGPGGPSASISYSAPLDSYMSATDYSRPADGRVVIRHELHRARCGVAYKAEPASIAMLDPHRPRYDSSRIAMLVCHSFQAEFDRDAAPPVEAWFCVEPAPAAG